MREIAGAAGRDDMTRSWVQPQETAHELSLQAYQASHCSGRPTPGGESSLCIILPFLREPT